MPSWEESTSDGHRLPCMPSCSHCHGQPAGDPHEITDDEYVANQNMTDDELIDLLSAGSITEDSEGYNSDSETQDRSSSSASEDTSPNPDIKLYPAETCPGIPRTGLTPDIPWWEVYGEGSAAEALLDMADNGLKCDEETRRILRKEVAESQTMEISENVVINEEISHDISDIIKDLDKFVLPILEDDDDEVAECKSDYNEVFATTMELQLSHRQRIASEESIKAVWGNLTRDVSNDNSKL